jgi:hypothetical protein
MLQVENARQSTDSPMDSPLLATQPQSQSPQLMHQQQFQQHSYYTHHPDMMYQQQAMEYAYQPVPQNMVPIKAETEPQSRRPRLSAGHTNENELKDMLHKNITRPLDAVAEDVILHERTSSSEKTKQLFAMLW